MRLSLIAENSGDGDYTGLDANAKRVINEATEGLDDFITMLKSGFNLSDELTEEIKLMFEKANCKKVSFEELDRAMGLSLHNKLVFNPQVLNERLPQALFIIFHELAHQYQFKKYGAKEMMDVYIGKTSLDHGALAMSQYEAVADEFAMRKLRQLKNRGLIDYQPHQARRAYGNNPSPRLFRTMLNNIRDALKSVGADNIEKAAEYIYNMAKVGIPSSRSV